MSIWLWLTLVGSLIVPIVQGQTERAEYVVSECYGAIFNFDCGAGNKIRINKDFFGYSTLARKSKKCSYSQGECIISNPKSNSLIHRFCTGHRVCTYYLVERRGCGGSFSNYQQVEYQCIPESMVTDVCSTVNYKATNTYIASPGFPENYPPRLNCRCLVSATTPNAKVRLEIVYLAIKYTSPCRDWLSIGSRRTCGTTMDLFQGRRIPIEFHSDEDESHSGFWLHFTSSIPGDEVHIQCGNITFRPPRRPNLRHRHIPGFEGSRPDAIERSPRPEDVPREKPHGGTIQPPVRSTSSTITTTAGTGPTSGPTPEGKQAGEEGDTAGLGTGGGEGGRSNLGGNSGSINHNPNSSNPSISTPSGPSTAGLPQGPDGAIRNVGKTSRTNLEGSLDPVDGQTLLVEDGNYARGSKDPGWLVTKSSNGTKNGPQSGQRNPGGISTTQGSLVGAGLEESTNLTVPFYDISATNDNRTGAKDGAGVNGTLSENTNVTGDLGDLNGTETSTVNSTGLSTTVWIGAANEDNDEFFKLGLVIMCVCIAIGVLLVLAAIIVVYCRRHRTRDEETQTPNKLKAASDGDSGQGLLVTGSAGRRVNVIQDVYAVPHKADKSLQIDMESDEYDDIIVCGAHVADTSDLDENDPSFYSSPYTDSNSKGVQVSFNTIAKARFRDKKRKRNKTLIGKGSACGINGEPICPSMETTECSSSDSGPLPFRPISESEPGSFSCSEQEMDLERKRSLASMSQYSEVTMTPENAVLPSENEFYDSFSDPDWDQKSAISI